MQPLAELFPALLQDQMDRPEVQEGIVKLAWKYCVGEKIRGISKPSIYHNGILTVEVSHSQWKTILESMKTHIISRMNQFLKKPLLKDISIIVV
jgi:predicted nucleic acid-binding Zn ribbon protein